MPPDSGFPAWTSWIAGAVGLLVGLWLLRLLLVLLNLLRHVLQRTHHRPLGEAEVPAHLRQALAPVVETLAAQGLQLQGYLAVRRLFAVARDEVLRAVLRSPDGRSWCTVGFADLPDPHNLHHVICCSWFDDGGALFTVNGAAHNVVGALPGVQLEDPLAPDAVGQWQHHARTLAGLDARGPRPLDSLQAFASALARVEDAYVDDLLQRGWLIPTAEPGRYRFSLAAALHAAWRMVRGHGRLVQLQQQRAVALRRQKLPPPQVPIEEEAGAFADVEVIRRTPSPRSFWIALFASSLLLFALSAARWVEPQWVWLVAAVVLMHELGHYAAMRLFDYGNTTIFFVPFFGAATTGSKRDAPLWQELLVLLAGPLPGLVVAGLVLWLRPPASGGALHEALSLLLLINLFNLLPVFPLDGGRVVHRLLFAHNRVLDALFKLLAAGTFLGLGLAASDGLLIALGAIIVLGIPTSLRLAGLQRRLAHRPGVAGDATVLAEQAFAVMREAGHAGVPFVTRVAWARALLEQGPARTRPGCLVALAWLLVYGGTLVGAFALLLRLFLGGPAADAPAPAWPEPSGPVLGLSCPADPQASWRAWRTQPADAAVSATWGHRWVLARFDSAAQAGAAAALLPAIAPPPTLARVENALVLAWPAMAAPSAERLIALQAQLGALGGSAVAQTLDDEVESEGEGVLELRCTPRDAEVRAQLVRELKDHFAAPPHALLRPPWWPREGEDPLPEAQQRARGTLRELSELQTQSISARSQGLAPVTGAISLCLASDEDERQQRALALASAHTQQLLQGVRQRIEQRRHDADFDVDTAELYLRWQEAGFRDPEESMRRQRALGTRLGALPVAGEVAGAPLPAPEAQAQQAWAIVVDAAPAPLRLYGLTLAQPAAGLPTLLSYLCARGCTALELRQGDAMIDESDRLEP